MINRYNYNIGQFGKTTQLTLYKDENVGLRRNPQKNQKGDMNPMAEKKKYQKDEPETSPRKEIKDADAWLNIGGKGFFVKIDGKEYITSVDSVKALLSGEKQGVKLGLLE